MNDHLHAVVRSPVLYPIAALYVCAVFVLAMVACGALRLWEGALILGVAAALIVSCAVAYETRQQVRRLRLALLEARRKGGLE